MFVSRLGDVSIRTYVIAAVCHTGVSNNGGVGNLRLLAHICANDGDNVNVRNIYTTHLISPPLTSFSPCAACLPWGLSVLLALISVFMFLFFKKWPWDKLSEDVPDRLSPNLHPMVGVWSQIKELTFFPIAQGTLQLQPILASKLANSAYSAIRCLAVPKWIAIGLSLFWF